MVIPASNVFVDEIAPKRVVLQVLNVVRLKQMLKIFPRLTDALDHSYRLQFQKVLITFDFVSSAGDSCFIRDVNSNINIYMAALWQTTSNASLSLV